MSIFANVESAQKALTSGPDLTRDVSNGGRSFLRFGGLMENQLIEVEGVLISLEDSQIITEYELSIKRGQESVQHAIRCGELLIAKKASLEHGEWLPWLEANMPFSQRTAQDYMRVAERNPQRAADLDSLCSIRQALAAMDDKKEQRRAKQAARDAELAANAPETLEFTVTSDQSVKLCQALITDPPYGILDESWEPKELEDFTRDWLTRWNNCGAELALVFFSQRYMWDAKAWFDECLSHYRFQQLLIWHYPNNKSPQSRKGFKQTWEPIFFYRRIDSDRQIGVGGTQWGDGLNDFDCHVSAVPQSNFNDANRKVHPAQKSLSVMRWLINATTQYGDLVVDPFCGSGTTGIAAAQLGRRFYGIETDSAMAEIACQRIKAYGV